MRYYAHVILRRVVRELGSMGEMQLFSLQLFSWELGVTMAYG